MGSSKDGSKVKKMRELEDSKFCSAAAVFNSFRFRLLSRRRSICQSALLNKDQDLPRFLYLETAKLISWLRLARTASSASKDIGPVLA